MNYKTLKSTLFGGIVLSLFACKQDSSGDFGTSNNRGSDPNLFSGDNSLGNPTDDSGVRNQVITGVSNQETPANNGDPTPAWDTDLMINPDVPGGFDSLNNNIDDRINTPALDADLSIDPEDPGSTDPLSTEITLSPTSSTPSSSDITFDPSECPLVLRTSVCRTRTFIRPEPKTVSGDRVSISGTVFFDLNRNGRVDDGEQGPKDAFLFVDWDGDCRPDLYEPRALTDASGRYKFENLPGEDGNPDFPENWKVLLIAPSGSQQALPRVGDHYVLDEQIKPGLEFSDLNFSLEKLVDFGDAPLSYDLNDPAKAAAHGHSSNYLGLRIDFETKAKNSVNADGDNLEEFCFQNDEDGVKFIDLTVGKKGKVEVSYTSRYGTRLSAWIDFNQNGVFDSNEEIILNPYMFGGVDLKKQVFEFDIPASIDKTITTYARFRLGNVKDIPPTGYIDKGEVEDYKITIKKD